MSGHFKLSTSFRSPVWQTCTDGNSIVLDGVVDGLEDSDGCYSSFDDDWDDCNDDCEDNLGVDSDDAVGVYHDQDVSASAPMMHVSLYRETDIYIVI